MEKNVITNTGVSSNQGDHERSDYYDGDGIGYNGYSYLRSITIEDWEKMFFSANTYKIPIELIQYFKFK